MPATFHWIPPGRQHEHRPRQEARREDQEQPSHAEGIVLQFRPSVNPPSLASRAAARQVWSCRESPHPGSVDVPLAVGFGPCCRYRSRISAAGTAPTGVIALKGATLVNVTRGTIPNGTIVLRDGKIAAVGANVQVPAARKSSTPRASFISPGIIDCHSTSPTTTSTREGRRFSSMTGMRDVLDRPTSTSIVTFAGGLTTATSCTAAPPDRRQERGQSSCAGGRRTRRIASSKGRCPAQFALGENPEDMTPGQPTGQRATPSRAWASST